MAHLRLEPPAPFNFRNPDDWPRWKRRFEQFRIASALADDSDSKQVNTLLYCLGEEAESVLLSTNLTAEERAVYNTVIKKLDDFFKVRRNIIFERARFNRRNQQEGESAEQYMELYRLAETCNYGDLKDEMIRDRLVVGIHDAALSQQLQMDAELTLEKAQKRIRQREAVGEQQKELKGAAEEEVTIQEVKFRRPKKGKVRHTPSHHGKAKTPKTCTRCGKGTHPYDKCPAKEATCHQCSKR